MENPSELDLENGEKHEDDAEPPSYNPSMCDDMKEDVEKIKGDAIGDTLYSARFVLATLLKLIQYKNQLADDEDFEKELCSLWDMTIEHDVVKLLLDQQALDVFSMIIKTTEDKRLTEIMIGIIGNMCDYPQTRSELLKNKDAVNAIIDLISCSDTLTLIQLMRFFSTVLVSDTRDDALMWFDYFRNCSNFVEHFSFILINSMNRQLLYSGLEALTAFCVKFPLVEFQSYSSIFFRDFFVHEYLVQGLLEAFKTLTPANESTDEDAPSLTEKTRKVMTSFLDISVVLLQYNDVSQAAFASSLQEFLKCISLILVPFCNASYLLPISDYELEIVDNINDIFQLLSDPFDSDCFGHMITIWDIIESNQTTEEKSTDEWSKDDSSNEIGAEACVTILDFVARTVKNASDEELKDALRSEKSNTIRSLLKSLKVGGDTSPDIQESCERIEKAFSDNADDSIV